MPLSSKFFGDFNSPPNTSDGHVWADYIEILCSVDPRQEISIDYLLDRFLEDSDTNDFADIEDSLTEGVEDYDFGYSYSSQKNDNITNKIKDWFSILQYRSIALQDFYPFTFSKDKSTLIRVAKKNFSDKHFLYLTLLLASNLKYTQNGKWHWLTNSFEIISWEVMKLVMPDIAEVHLFSSKHGETSQYSGNARNKLRKLAVDLGEQVSPDLSFIPANSSGDLGLDVIAWIPLGDNQRNRIVIFGQCACSAKDWKNKRFSVHPDSWRKRINFQLPPTPVMFIPHCFRDSQGNWENEDETSGVALVDRQRILWVLHGHRIKRLINLESKKVVNHFLDYRIDTF